MSKQIWRIYGYDGDRAVFTRTVPRWSLSESEMIRLLQRLASRHLTVDEVVSASLRKNADAYATHLEVQRNYGGKYAFMTTGSGHYYSAIVSDGH